MAPLAVNSIHPDPVQRATNGPYILSCGYCSWTTQNIGWQFEKVTNIHQQISKLKIGGQEKSSPTKRSEHEANTDTDSEPTIESDPDFIFGSLRSFYNSQLSAANPSDPILTPSGGFNYSSPNSLARIMSLYTGRSFYGKRGQDRPALMREAVDTSEGLRTVDVNSDDEAIQELQTAGWAGTASTEQRSKQQQDPPHFTSDLRPIRVLLRTKRSKRCRTCRHILVKPEPKVQSVRFRIKLVAVNYIPTIYLKPLHPPQPSQLPLTDLNALPTLRPIQFLLTLKNPLFEPIKVTLATPTHTPGRYSHKVTILCPQLDIGANLDQWDEALADGKGKRASKILSVTKAEYSGGEGGKVAEAGKVWDKERNWTTVVVEVVCATVDGEAELAEDEDVLEIPVFVRMEWEADVERDEGGGKVDERKEKKELAYWVILGVGRVESERTDS